MKNRWFLGMMMGSAIFLCGRGAIAQNITLDGTLGSEGTLNGPVYTIPQAVGQTVGNNLFHSFGRFSLDTGERANFQSASNIRNILSRVTGGIPSSIDGLIFTSSPRVNLFLINPSGIIFGPNARLDVGGTTRGSFIATTSEALVWSNGSQFSATNPTGSSSLLTIVGDPSGFLTSLNQPKPIDVLPKSTLETYNGQSLLLVGGDIRINGGRMRAMGGRVELGGLAEPGTVGLQISDNNLSLNFPANTTLADVSLTNVAEVYVRANGGGSIAINARDLNMANQSRLLAGIEEGLGSINSVGGNIEINATSIVKLTGNSIIQNALEPEAMGKGGNTRIVTGSIALTDGSFISSSTFGRGVAGSVIINARDRVSLDRNSVVFSSVEPTGVGKSEGIYITTGILELTNGSQLVASIFGQGSAGDVVINARDAVFFDGASSDGVFSSAAISRVEETGRGKGGDIRIITRSLSLTNGAELLASTRGQGDSGNVIIDVRDRVSLDNSNVLSSVNWTGIEPGRGKGGDIRITTRDLSLTNGAQLLSGIFGQGDAGNIIINSQERVFIDGTSRDGRFSSGAFSSVEQTGRGSGGDISITTKELLLTNGARLSANTSGQGDAGNVIINATERVSLDGKSAVLSGVDNTGVGSGKDIRITTRTLSLTNGAQLLATTLGQGNAGNVFVDARDTVSLQGVGDNRFSSGIFTTTYSETGVGGKITFRTNNFRITDGAIVDAITFSSKTGGSIIINSNTFYATNGGQVTTNTGSSGQAGTITLNATESVTLSGSDPTYANRFARFGGSTNVDAASGLFASTNSEASGNGGGIFVNSSKLTVEDGAKIAVNSQGTGVGGNINIQANNLTLKNQALISAETVSNQGGNIDIGLKDILLLRQGSRISTNAGTDRAGGDGGNITINVKDGFIVAVPSENSDITANAFSGSGGRITIRSSDIFGIAPLTRQDLQKLSPDLDPRQVPTSDITAISQTNPTLSGTIELNTLEVDPNSGLVELPTIPVDTEIAQGCYTPGYTQSSFVITGRGGLPPNPKDVLTPDAVELDWVTLNPNIDNLKSPSVTTKPKTTTPEPIVEATGWVRNSKGEVEFVVNAPTTTPHGSWQNLVSCHAS